MKRTTISFISGATMAIAGKSLYADYLGKEAFLELVDENWIDSALTAPMAIAVLFAALICFLGARVPNR